MAANFDICLSKCKSQKEALNKCSKQLESYLAELEDAKNSIIDLKGSGFNNIAEALVSVITEIENEKKSLILLKEGLEKSVYLYKQTESDIIDEQIGINVINKIAEGIISVSDFRSQDIISILESFLTKGIFSDNVIDDIGKIMNGTYISSHWENGSLYIKLHCKDYTNSQVGEWLKEHLGGNWDDYKSRNMRNNGFDIYNDSGFTRKLRYFDDVTDAELAKYIKNMTDQGGISFGKAFRNNFFDDFNYKDFGELGTLGKTGKILGTAGTVLTIGGDVVDNFYSPDTGEWSFSGNQAADCVCDIGIDLAAGAGSAAAGAAVGSLIVPPVGTVVGAGVGIAIDVAANNIRLFDVDGDGNKDSLVDTVKIGAHYTVDKVEEGLDNFSDWASDVGKDMGNWFTTVFAF